MVIDFRSRLPSSLLSLEEVQKRDRQWREYFDLNESSTEEKYNGSEGLCEYALIRDFVLQENGKNIVDSPAFQKQNVRI